MSDDSNKEETIDNSDVGGESTREGKIDLTVTDASGLFTMNTYPYQKIVIEEAKVELKPVNKKEIYSAVCFAVDNGCPFTLSTDENPGFRFTVFVPSVYRGLPMAVYNRLILKRDRLLSDIEVLSNIEK